MSAVPGPGSLGNLLGCRAAQEGWKGNVEMLQVLCC